MQKIARVFTSFKEADAADARSDAAMSPQQRIEIVLELRAQRHPDAIEQRLERVFKVIELERS